MGAKKTARFYSALAVGKLASVALEKLGRNGGQIPGKIAETIDPEFLAHIDKPEHIVFVTGTNGKTTTSNLIDDLLQDNGFEPVTNRAGGNVANGIESTLIKNAGLDGSQRESFACMELDELSSRLVLPNVTPDILLVCNLYRDSFMRNANPDYIFDVLSSNISPETELILNADDLISCRLAPQAEKRTYFSIAPLAEDTPGPQGIVCDLTACPHCGAALEYDYCHLRHLGKARCTRCGFTNPSPDYEVTRVDREKHTFTVRENNLPDRPEHDYHIAVYSITNLYNLLAAVVTARRLGVSADDIAASLERGINITSLRYSAQEAAGVRLVNVAAKGENSTATSTAIATICDEPGEKAVVLIMSDAYLAKSPYSSEYTGWYYQTDFETLNDPQVKQVIVVGARGEDLMVRLRLAGVESDRVSLVPDAETAAVILALEGLEGVFIAYDIFNGDQAETCRNAVRARLESAGQQGSELEEAPASAEAAEAEDPEDLAEPEHPKPAHLAVSPQELLAEKGIFTDVPPEQGAGAVIEILYPEFGNQAGDNGNALYLKSCLPGATFIETPYGAEPAFVTQDVDAVLMGSLVESHQVLAARALRPYADRLAELADKGKPMLFTHSAAEVLGTAFGTPSGSRENGLGVLDFATRQDMPRRYLGTFVGTFTPDEKSDPLTILGFKIQFTQARGNNSSSEFAKIERGWGLSEASSFEGFRRGGLIATWLIGPILPTNPDFAQWFCERIAGTPIKLAFEKDVRLAYDVRHAELTKPLPKGKTIKP